MSIAFGFLEASKGSSWWPSLCFGGWNCPQSCTFESGGTLLIQNACSCSLCLYFVPNLLVIGVRSPCLVLLILSERSARGDYRNTSTICCNCKSLSDLAEASTGERRLWAMYPEETSTPTLPTEYPHLPRSIAVWDWRQQLEEKFSFGRQQDTVLYLCKNNTTRCMNLFVII